MKKFTPITFPGRCDVLTLDQQRAIEASLHEAGLLLAGLTLDDVHEVHGKLKTTGLWQLPVSYKALATTTTWEAESCRVTGSAIFGVRTLSHPGASGHCLEGRLVHRGVGVRAFTSSQLFQLASGHLVSVATLHVCKPE